MKKIYFILFSVIALSCTKEPVADFTTNKSVYDEGDLVVCTNTSQDASTYEWGSLLSNGNEKDFSFFLLPNQISATIEMIAYSDNLKKSDYISKTITIRLKCEKNNTGTYYFKNSTSGILTIKIDGGAGFNVLSGQNSQTLTLSAGVHSYYVVDNNYHTWQGNFDVIQCEENWSYFIL
ncbi:MAG: hypothetical protein WCK02_12960 [Bacteroidota bacterium]